MSIQHWLAHLFGLNLGRVEHHYAPPDEWALPEWKGDPGADGHVCYQCSCGRWYCE